MSEQEETSIQEHLETIANELSKLNTTMALISRILRNK